jgi:hypothetical protein
MNLFGTDEPQQRPARKHLPKADEPKAQRPAVPDPVRPLAEPSPAKFGGRWQILRLNMSAELKAELAGPLFDHESLRAGLRGCVGFLDDDETLAVCRMVQEYFSKRAAEPQNTRAENERGS